MTSPVKVAFVDDEVDLRSLFSIFFKKEVNAGQLEIQCFSDGHACMDHLSNSEQPSLDLILTDVQMPGMDGFELLDQIKKFDPKIKVYLATAYDSKEYRDKADKLGADKYLEKPLVFDEIRDLINEFSAEMK